MSSTAERVDRLTAWEDRESSFHRVLPLIALAAATLLAVFVEVPGAQPLPATLAVAAMAAGWITWFLLLHRRSDRRSVMVVYYAGFLVLAAVLVLCSPWYGFFAWVGFIHAFIALPGNWRFAGVAGTAVLVATAQSGGTPSSAGHWLIWLVVVLVNFGVAGAITWFSSVSKQQTAYRKRLIEELAETNRKLAETMRENEGLHAQLLNQAREAGVLDERQRMAREIHDTLAQGLIGIITQLEAAGQARDSGAEWRRHVDAAAALARESLAEARRSVQALRPQPLEAARLPDALADLVQRWSAVTGVPAEITTTGTPRQLHPEIEVTLLRTAQEALANVAKHANASRVVLTLSYMGDLVTLDVRDDGVGFEPERVAISAADGGRSHGEAAGDSSAKPLPGGFGLIAMRQRVDRVAGRLEIESEPGGGTAVSASVPAVAGAAA